MTIRGMNAVELPSPAMTLIEHGVEHGIHWVTCRAPLFGAAAAAAERGSD